MDAIPFVAIGILVVGMLVTMNTRPRWTWRVFTSLTVAVLALYVIVLAQRPYV